MENGGEEVTARAIQRSAPQPSATRGNRRAGRGRKKSSSTTTTTRISNPPTFQGRTTQLRALEGAPVETTAVAPAPLSALSAAMDNLYPSSMEPHLPPQHVMIHCAGFMDLCSQVYKNMILKDDKLERYLSEPEFLLCSGQILVRHVLWIRTHALNTVVTDQHILFDCIPQDTPVASPIELYLSGLGLIRHNTGELLVPNIVLPRWDVQNSLLAGMLPSIYGDNYTTHTHWSLNSSMIQFGLLRRAIINAHNGTTFYAGNSLRLDPAKQSNDDVHWARFNCLPRCGEMYPMSAYRVGKISNIFYNKVNSFLDNTICWSPQIFQSYLLFMERAKTVISVSTIPKSTAGTPAYLAWAVPEKGDDVTYPSTFLYYANIKLTTAEQHAARLFRYRTRLVRKENSSEQDFSDATKSFDAAPISVSLATMSITAVVSYDSYIGQFVRHFMKS